MALTDENGGGIPATMLVGPASVGNGGMGMPYPVPMYGGFGGGNQGGMGGFGGENGWWIVLLIIVIAALGGRGFGGNNGGGGFGGGAPIIVNDSGSSGGAVQRGFDQAAVMSGIGAIQSGVQGLSTQLCNCCGDMQMAVATGFAGTNAAINGAQNALAQQLYTNQIADLERSFAAQTASTQGMTGLQSQLAQCCCDNRLATEQLRYTIATENCADRYEAAQNTRDIIESQTRSTQTILDKLCQLELDGYKRENDNLRTQLTAANFAASQTAQTARILDNNNAQTASLLRDNAAQTVALEQYLNPTPVPAYIVQNPNCCPQNNCGCGCGGSFAN